MKRMLFSDHPAIGGTPAACRKCTGPLKALSRGITVYWHT